MNRVKKMTNPDAMPVPFCIIQGTEDMVVSKKESQLFYYKFGGGNKGKFIEVPDSWHCIYKDPAFSPENWQQIQLFIMDK
jgi:hypothetical protein